MEDSTYNHMITYPETHLVYCKLIVEDKFDIKVMSVVDIILGKIINKLQSTNFNHVFIW